MRSAVMVAFAMLVAALAGCNDEQEPQQAAQVKIEPVEHVAWLSRKLPESTIGYLRLPLLWDSFFQPRANALSNPQTLAVHQQQLQTIRDGLASNIS